jgi:simple sugar transport system permease protein
MSTATATKPAKSGKPGKPARRRLTLPWVLILIAAALALVSLVRIVTNADDVTSVGQVSGALRLAVPIGLAGLGGLWSERSGVVNIGLEGMMILGTWFGAWAGYQWGPWTGVLMGIVGGALGGLLHAVVTVTFGVNHIVSGVALNILALGVTKYLSKFTFEEASGSSKQSPNVDTVKQITIPGLADWMKDLNGKHWFLISDIAGFVGGAVTNLSLLTVLAVVLVAGSWWVLWRTSFGLRLRSCGENPQAAETLGVNVYKYKYIAVIVSGALAGLGGYFLVDAAGIYQDGQTGGRGYIGLAAMIFGNWLPGGLSMGALLFGYTDSLNVRAGGANVHALLLLLVIVLGLLMVWLAVRKRFVPAAVSAVIGALTFVWYLGTDEVPSQFVAMAPYVTTLVVLALFSQRLRMPRADGLPYRRGEGT